MATPRMQLYSVKRWLVSSGFVGLRDLSNGEQMLAIQMAVKKEYEFGKHPFSALSGNPSNLL
jgi:hypothetical protein